MPRKPTPPGPGGEYTQVIDLGPQGVPPGLKVVQLIPVGDGGPGTPPPPPVTRRKKKRRLLPTAAEIDALPRLARAAFAERCARRVSPGSDGAPADAQDVTAVVTRAALQALRDATDPADVTLIRRDFDRLRWLAKQDGWTDETPVPVDVLGPLWPRGRVPDWAKDKPRG